MRIALALARKGRKAVFPNPMVGCVIVNDGRVVGKGFHERFGGPHAEINALADAGKKARGSTMYVTLEPCDHYGKTPPCTVAIRRSGVRRVVAATLDPDEKARGKGMKALRMHSVETNVGLLARESERLNAQYMATRRQKESAVIVKVAMSVDGKIATRTGDSKWISSVASRDYVHHLRSTVDAILVGRETISKDNPELTSHEKGPNPVRVVIDPQLKIPMGARVFNKEAPTIVFHKHNASLSRVRSLRKNGVLAVALPKQKGRMDFGKVVAKLHQFSLKRVLIEGGGETIASALEAGVVTDYVAFVAPMIIGGRSSKTPVEGLGIANINKCVKLSNLEVKKYGTDFMLTAKVRNR